MSDFRRRWLSQSLQSIDILATFSAFVIGASVVSSQLPLTTFAEFLSLRIKVQNFLLFFGLLFLYGRIFKAMGLYQSKRLSKLSDEIANILKAVLLCTLAILIASTVFQIEMITFVFLVVFGSVNFILLAFSRLILRTLLHYIRAKGRNLRDILIIGTNERTVQFAKKIESRPELGYHLLGFVDQPWHGLDAFEQTGYSLACGLDGLNNFLRQNVVDEVMIGLPLRSLYRESSDIVRMCEQQGIIVRFLSNIFALRIARSKAEEFEGDTLLTVYTGHMEGWPIFIKRILDFLLATVILILLTPVLLTTALLVKLTSPGPVLFLQERVGLNKRKFRLYKFRSMVTDAEQRLPELEEFNEVSGPVFKVKNDPRVTPIGRFLRKTSIDELPQLFNVLLGNMSLVGPRPLPARDCDGFYSDSHRRRFSVRPGITCLWQINGRSEIPFERWMELDMQYIDDWSLWLDLKILIRTIPVVLRGSGAA